MAWRPDYITLAQFKAYKTIDDTIDDAELSGAITAASRAIDNGCGRQFGKVDAPEQRFYTPKYNARRGRWSAAIDDLQSAVGLVVTVDGVTVTDYTLEPRNAVAEGLAWTRLVLGPSVAVSSCTEPVVAATASWGWAAFPGAVVLAAKIQSHRFANRRDSPYGVAGSPDQGSELRLLAKMDPDVAVSVGLYVRPRAVG